MASSSASRRSSIRVSFRNRRKPRIRSRAAWYSSSSLACSGQEIARAEGEHMEHLLKTSQEKVTRRRKKSKCYFRFSFAHVRGWPRDRKIRVYRGGLGTANGIAQFLDSCNLGVLSTIAGAPESALAGIAVTMELEVAFDTVERSRKFANLMRDPRVSLAAGWRCEVTVQLVRQSAAHFLYGTRAISRNLFPQVSRWTGTTEAGG